MSSIQQTAAPSPVADAPAAARDLQRRNLEQIVRLSIECTAEEQRLEQHRTEVLARENAEYEKTTSAAKQRGQRRQAELAATVKLQQKSIQSRYDEQRQTLETSHESTRRALDRTRDQTESALKTQVEEECWESESALVALEIKVDADEQKSRKELEAGTAELASLDLLEVSAHECLARYGLVPFPVETPDDPALRQRLAADRLAVLAEVRPQAEALLRQLEQITESRVVDDLVPLFLVLVFAAGAGTVGWFAPQDSQTRLLASAGAVVGGLVVGAVIFVILRARIRAKVRARARTVFGPFVQVLTIARQAAFYDAPAAAAARQKRVADAHRKRDQEQAAAKEKAISTFNQTVEQYRTNLADETRRYQDQLAAIEEVKDRGLAELTRLREETGRDTAQEYDTTRAAAKARRDQAIQTLEAGYQRDTTALTARWNDGLKAVTDLIAAGGGIDPQLVDWNSPAWEQWQSPAEFSGQLRFGEMKVDIAQLTAQIPQRLKLPETFSVPALLTLPDSGSLLFESDHTGRAACIDAAQMVMTRILTQMPAGHAKFTIFDPIGLGQSFAGFMHLADHDESLVGSRIWTEKEHMEQRLTDLTEHMETVIQKYLRNEYATIDEYNAQAGELAEPIRFLVIADFPTGFEPETLRRLSSITLSGPRCGVYTIILRDTRQPPPPGSRMEEIFARSIRLQFKDGAGGGGGGFTWDDAVFKRFPLRLDPPPGEKTLTRLMDQVGKAAKKAKRVEVPFSSIAPAPDQFWSRSTQDHLRVPIGKTGATRLQSLRLGVGVAQHALIAGKTGSGKSNLMHTIVTNLAMWHSPDEVEFYLIDFKKGVEFKPYVTSELPHARAIAVASDREFGLSVLQRVDAELTRRGNMFRNAGVQDINSFRDRTGQKLPRTLLLIDEFQEFFSEDDKLGQEAAGLIDRLVRQGRAFGVHLILGSQTIGGTSGLGRSTLGQIAVRIALQCTEADSQMILGDNNSAARLLSRPGEAVYNDAGGLVEANSPFQIAFLPDDQREQYLQRIQALTRERAAGTPEPIVFEGNSAALIRKNHRLMALLGSAAYPPAASSVPAFVGEPVAIKEPTSVPFRRQSGANALLVGQDEESALAIFASMAASLAAQHQPADAVFYLLDGTPHDSRYFGRLERVLASLPHQCKIVAWRDVPQAINELATLLTHRNTAPSLAPSSPPDTSPSPLSSPPSAPPVAPPSPSPLPPPSSPPATPLPDPSVYLLLFGLQRYRLLRRQEDDFSFGRGEEPAAPKPEKQFAEILSEGPALGLHTIVWADTPITVERTLDRNSMRQFDFRILFQMSATDSSNLIDAPTANRLGPHRALLYSEEQGTIEKFRPYEAPDDNWLQFLASRLRGTRANPPA